MNVEILCQLLSKRIEPTKFQIHGLDVFWIIEPTKEELLIVDDVIKNYDHLKGEYILEEKLKKENSDLFEHLKENDIKCVRAIREWIIGASTGMVSALKIYDVIAQQARDRLDEIKISKV